MATKNYGLITDVDELQQVTKRIHGNVFGFDCETGYHGPEREKGAVHPETAILVGISFTDSTDWARYVPLGHDEGENLDNTAAAAIFWDLLQTGMGVAHNAGFELRHLARWFMKHLADDPLRGAAVRASGGYYPVRSDTMVEAYLAADFQRFGLKPLTLLMFDRDGETVPSSQYFERMDRIAEINAIKDEGERKQAIQDFDGHAMTELHELFPDLAANRRKFLRFNTLPLDAHIVEYACEDSVWCLAIHQHYYPKVKDRLLYEVEMAIVQEVVPHMEDEGICYDWALMRRTAEQLRDFRDRWNAEIMTELTELVGQPVALNLASPPQVRKVLFEQLELSTSVYTDRTRDLPPEQRVMSTGDIALTKLGKQVPVVKKILQWREMTKLLGTYLDKYENLFNYADDGRAHPSHLSAFVITGRFAVSDPPYQGCLTGQANVLTPSGWERLDKLADGTPVAQYHADGTLSFVVPEVIRNPYSADLLEFESREGGTWTYTPDHRIVYRLRKSRGDRGLTAIKECRADQWAEKLRSRPSGPLGSRMNDWRVPKAGMRRGGRVLDEQARRSLRLAIACQADGHLNWKAYDVRIFRSRKLVALQQLGVPFTSGIRSTIVNGKSYTGTEYRARIHATEVEEWLDDSREKNFRTDAILALCAADLRWFVNEVMQWDGDSTRGRTFAQDERRRSSVETVQAAAALCGYTTSLYEQPQRHLVTVNVWDRDHKDPGWQKVRQVPSDGMVYCVSVPTGMFLCRNDQGKVMVTGNSPKKYHFDLVEAKAAHEAGEEPPPGTCFTFNFRDVITAPPEHYILGFDLSQAELRAIAGEAQETALLEAFANGDDVHRVTASLMLGIPLDEVTDELRAIGKLLNFALLYGMSVKGLADRLGIPIEEAQVLMDKYFSGLSGIAAYMSKQVTFGQANGFVVSKFGRRMPIWEYRSTKRWIYQKGDRACLNYPIQGAATGDYVKIAMVRAVRAIRKAGLSNKMKLVMNVHDALEFYVHESVSPQDAIAVIKDAVIFPVSGWPSMKADWHIAKRWGSPMEVEVAEDGTLTIAGQKLKDSRPEVQEGEDGVPVEELPEVDPQVLREAARPGFDSGRQVRLTLSVMPQAENWRAFKDMLRRSPGPNHLRVFTPEGELELPFTTALRPDHLLQVSRLFGDSDMTLTYAVDAATDLIAGLTL